MSFIDVAFCNAFSARLSSMHMAAHTYGSKSQPTQRATTCESTPSIDLIASKWRREDLYCGYGSTNLGGYRELMIYVPQHMYNTFFPANEFQTVSM